MATRTDEVWKQSSLASVYLEGVRGAIPLAAEQIDVMVRLGGRAGGHPRAAVSGPGLRRRECSRRRCSSVSPDAEGVLVDFSAPMLEAAGKRLAGRAVRFVNADYGVPAWKDAAGTGLYDAIVSGYSIHHQPDERKREVYAEIFHLLSAGGVFVNVEHVSSPSPWLTAINDDMFVDSLHAHHRGQSREEVASHVLPASRQSRQYSGAG